jgi:hypothetical protein
MLSYVGGGHTDKTHRPKATFWLPWATNWELHLGERFVNLSVISH